MFKLFRHTKPKRDTDTITEEELRRLAEQAIRQNPYVFKRLSEI